MIALLLTLDAIGGRLGAGTLVCITGSDGMVRVTGGMITRAGGVISACPEAAAGLLAVVVLAGGIWLAGAVMGGLWLLIPANANRGGRPGSDEPTTATRASAL